VDKLRILAASASLDADAWGALLRREGLHHAEVEQWRTEVLGALEDPRAQRTELAAERSRVRLLEREVARKDRALAETAALLVLQKKFRAFLEAEAESTPARSGR
jgi:hypothetical protein